MLKKIEKIIEPLKRRILLMIGRCIVTAVNDDDAIQSLQIKTIGGVVLDNVERFQDYGYTSVPHIGAEGFVSFVGGNTAHGLVNKADDRRYRPTGLKPGEVAIYDDLGKTIILKRNGDIEVNAPRLLLNGNLEVSGNIHATGSIIDDAGNTNNHSH